MFAMFPALNMIELRFVIHRLAIIRMGEKAFSNQCMKT